MMHHDRKFDFQVTPYYASQNIETVKGCNAITVTNIGDTIAYINGAILYPGTPGSTLGDSRSFGGNENEVYTGRLTLRFDNPPGATPAVEVIQKFYIDAQIGPNN